MSGYGRADLFTPPCVSFQAKKNGRRKADQPPAAAIYAAQTEAAQPPDDRTYSAEVTSFLSNLLHHRSARIIIPYTRPIILAPISCFVKNFFRKNHKIFYGFSYKTQGPPKAALAFLGNIFMQCFSRPNYGTVFLRYGTKPRNKC